MIRRRQYNILSEFNSLAIPGQMILRGLENSDRASIQIGLDTWYLRGSVNRKQPSSMTMRLAVTPFPESRLK